MTKFQSLNLIISNSGFYITAQSQMLSPEPTVPRVAPDSSQVSIQVPLSKVTSLRKFCSQFTEKEIQIATKPMKRCPNSLIVRET